VFSVVCHALEEAVAVDEGGEVISVVAEALPGSETVGEGMFHER